MNIQSLNKTMSVLLLVALSSTGIQAMAMDALDISTEFIGSEVIAPAVAQTVAPALVEAAAVEVIPAVVNAAPNIAAEAVKAGFWSATKANINSAGLAVKSVGSKAWSYMPSVSMPQMSMPSFKLPTMPKLSMPSLPSMPTMQGTKEAAAALWAKTPNMPSKDTVNAALSATYNTATNPYVIAGVTAAGLVTWAGYKYITHQNKIKDAVKRSVDGNITIDLIGKGISTISDIAKLVKAEDLDKVVFIKLNQNNLTEVSEDLINFAAQCPNLKNVWMGQNKITELPANLFVRLPQVEVFGFADNKLTDLPQEIVAVQKSAHPRGLRLANNPLPANLLAVATIS